MPTHRLEGDLGAELRRVGYLEKCVSLAERTVLRERATGLAHEPDGRSLNRLETRGPDEERVGHARRVAPDSTDRGFPRLRGVGARGTTDPLAPRWGSWTLDDQLAGVSSVARVELENGGLATWRSDGPDGLQLSYHWLDLRGNAIVWDGPRTSFPAPVAPGARVALDVPLVAPRPPGRYVLRFDLVEEHHFWLSEVGVAPLDVEVTVGPRIPERRLSVVMHWGSDPGTEAALARQEEPLVHDEPVAVAHLVAGAQPAPDWSRLILDAHTEGWGAVGSAIVPTGPLLERRRLRHRLADWAPGGRNPRFERALLLPSLLAGREPVEQDGLPATPAGDDALFEGRAVVRLPTQSGRRRS